MGKNNRKPKKQNSKAKVKNKESENKPIKTSANTSDYLGEVKTDSLLGYIDYVIKLIADTPGEYIFRGQSKESWPVSCGTQRRYNNSSSFEPIIQNDNKELVNRAREDRHDYMEGQKLNDLEIIAQLQHYGAATMLIDFTKRSLVALWFACNEHGDEDGVVYICDIIDYTRFTKCENNYLSLVNTDYKKRKDNFFYGSSTKISYWKPSKINQRVCSQDSIFLFGCKEIPKSFLYRIVIDKQSKENILQQLKIIDNIDEFTLYNDLYGLAQANKYDKKPSIQPLKFQLINIIQLSLEKKYESAIDGFDDLESKIEKRSDISEDEKMKYLQAIKLHRGYTRTRLVDDHKGEEDKNSILKMAEEDFDKTFEQFNSDQIKNDDNLRFWFGVRGYIKLVLEKYKEAIKDFDYVISKGGNEFELYANRGYAELSIKKYKEALEDFNSAIEKLESMGLEKLPASPYANRGFTYLNLSEYLEAIRDLEKANSLKPDDENINGHIGLAKMFLGLETSDFNLIKNSLRFYNKAIDCNQNLSQWYGRRAYVSFLLHDFDNAEKDLIKAMNINPDDIHSHEGLMEIQKIKGGPDIILNICQDAIKKDPESPFIFFILGKIYNALNKKEEAKEALNKAIAFAQKQEKHYYILYQSKELLEKISKQ